MAKKIKRLINITDLIEAINDELYMDESTKAAFRSIVYQQPLINAVPVVHGRWMLESKAENSNGGHTHYCDHCHDYYTTDADSLYFCPRCGAKMIEVEQPGRNGWKMELVDGELKRVWGVINERFVKTRTEEDFPNCGAKMDGGVCDG